MKLGSVVEIVGGGTPNRKKEDFWNGNIPWISVKDFKSNIINESKETITEKGLEYSSTKLIPKGTIVIPTRMALGKVAITEIDTAINQDLKALIVQEKNLDTRYLLYFLMSKSKYIESQGKGATVKGIKIDVLKDLDINVPSLEKQKQIVEILDISQSLIHKRKNQIDNISELIQSVFYELFGDPLKNSRNYPKRKVDSLTINEKSAIKSGPFGSQLLISELVQEGIPVFNIENVGLNNFVYTNNKCISPMKFNQLKSFEVKRGDILISRTGTVGRTCVTPEIDRAIIGPNLLKVSLDTNLIKPEYFSHIFNYLPNIKDQVKRASPGATVPVFNTKNLKSIEILVPSIQEQISFVDRINKIEKQGKLFKDSLKLLEYNFDALMYRVFNEEF